MTWSRSTRAPRTSSESGWRACPRAPAGGSPSRCRSRPSGSTPSACPSSRSASEPVLQRVEPDQGLRVLGLGEDGVEVREWADLGVYALVVVHLRPLVDIGDA